MLAGMATKLPGKDCPGARDCPLRAKPRAAGRANALRGVDHEELVGSAQAAGVIAKGDKGGRHMKLSDGDLGDVFGIELAVASPVSAKAVPRKLRVSEVGRRTRKSRRRSRRRRV